MTMRTRTQQQQRVRKGGLPALNIVILVVMGLVVAGAIGLAVFPKVPIVESLGLGSVADFFSGDFGDAPNGTGFPGDGVTTCDPATFTWESMEVTNDQIILGFSRDVAGGSYGANSFALSGPDSMTLDTHGKVSGSTVTIGISASSDIAKGLDVGITINSEAPIKGVGCGSVGGQTCEDDFNDGQSTYECPSVRSDILKATVYDDVGPSGKSGKFYQDDPQLLAAGPGSNDQVTFGVSAVEVVEGYKITLFESTNYKDHRITIVGTADTLKWKERTDSFEILGGDSCYATLYGNPGIAVEDRGRYTSFAESARDIRAFNQLCWANKQVNTVRVTGGDSCQAKLYTDPDFGGPCMMVGSENSEECVQTESSDTADLGAVSIPKEDGATTNCPDDLKWRAALKSVKVEGGSNCNLELYNAEDTSGEPDFVLRDWSSKIQWEHAGLGTGVSSASRGGGATCDLKLYDAAGHAGDSITIRGEATRLGWNDGVQSLKVGAANTVS